MSTVAQVNKRRADLLIAGLCRKCRHHIGPGTVQHGPRAGTPFVHCRACRKDVYLARCLRSAPDGRPGRPRLELTANEIPLVRAWLVEGKSRTACTGALLERFGEEGRGWGAVYARVTELWRLMTGTIK